MTWLKGLWKKMTIAISACLDFTTYPVSVERDTNDANKIEEIDAMKSLLFELKKTFNLTNWESEINQRLQHLIKRMINEKHDVTKNFTLKETILRSEIDEVPNMSRSNFCSSLPHLLRTVLILSKQ